MSPQQLGPNHDTKITNIQKDIPILEQKLKDAQYKAASAIYSGVQVLQRHHFSSKLQRMSVVCKCENTSKNGAKGKILLNIVLCLFFSALCVVFSERWCRPIAVLSHSHYILVVSHLSLFLDISPFLQLAIEESWYCLVKGSPEALKHLMVPSSIPTW